MSLSRKISLLHVIYNSQDKFHMRVKNTEKTNSFAEVPYETIVMPLEKIIFGEWLETIPNLLRHI